MSIIGIDSGATLTRIWNGQGEVRRISTPRGYSDYLRFIAGELRGDQPLESLVVALAAIVERQRVTVAPNLEPDWVGQDFAGDLRKQLDIRGTVTLCQDTEAAGYGVQAHELDDLDPTLLATLSSGVGGALVRSDTVEPLEVGHMVLNLSGANRRCACGQLGCVEADLSGTGILAWRGQRAEQIEEPAFWQDYGRQLGRFFLVVTVLFKLKQIVLIGGLSTRAPLFLDEARRELAASLVYVPLPVIRLARQGDALGVVGAHRLAELQLVGREKP
jgi:glucokinase